MSKYFLLVIFLFSCQNRLEREYGSQAKFDFAIVERIINGADSLDKILSDTSISTREWRINYWSLTERLKNHILINKFRDGFTFEKDTLQEIGNINWETHTTSILYVRHKIKIRSNTTNDIIWFSFINSEGNFKLVIYEVCNNRMLPDVDDPCDKS